MTSPFAHTEAGAPCGITEVSRHPRAAWKVENMPDGMTGVYQLGHPFQLSPTEAGITLNIRCSGVKAIDLEVGNDLLIFDHLHPFALDRIQPLCRAGKGINPKTGREILLSRYPKNIGFVPHGALLENGAPHPHAGTGFAIGQVLGFPADRLDRTDPFSNLAPEDIFYALEVIPCSYDGRIFRTGEPRLFDIADLLPGCLIGGGSLGPIIPDGENLMMAISGDPVSRDGKIRGCGLLRWHRRQGQWQPFRFDSVISLPDQFNTISGITGNFVEPTVTRDRHGALFFTAREVGPQPFAQGPLPAERLQIWRSDDRGSSWERQFSIPHFHPLTPLSLNRAADGTLYVAANGYATRNSKGEHLNSIVLRENLQLWPLKENGSGLEDPISIRDGVRELPPPPFGSFWRLDHPIALTVRLQDRQWHHLIVYRILEHNECDSDAPITDWTGCYIEEVLSRGPAIPVWHFA